MITWTQKDLIGKAPHSVAFEALENLERSTGWSLIRNAMLEEASRRRDVAGRHTINAEDGKQVFNHNLNVLIADLLESVSNELVTTMMEQCKQKKKGDQA